MLSERLHLTDDGGRGMGDAVVLGKPLALLRRLQEASQDRRPSLEQAAHP